MVLLLMFCMKWKLLSKLFLDLLLMLNFNIQLVLLFWDSLHKLIELSSILLLLFQNLCLIELFGLFLCSLFLVDLFFIKLTLPFNFIVEMLNSLSEQFYFFVFSILFLDIIILYNFDLFIEFFDLLIFLFDKLLKFLFFQFI